MRLSDLIKRHLGKAIFLFVAGYSLVYAIAFIQLYSMEHPYRVASAWIYEHIAPGSTIVSPHWDDKIPVTLPGPGNRVPQIFKMDGREFELPVYEQDNPPNIQLLLKRIAAADYVSFATPRTPDSIPRIENEYPHTTAIIQLLWAEKLGFSFATSVKNRPSFLGITFNDDLADESFSVYDHPKVTIFQNVDHLPVEELTRRINEVENLGPLPTMNEMLLMDEGGWVGKPASQLGKKLIPIICAVTFLHVIALGFWGVFGPRLNFLRDRGLGLSPLLGLVFAGGVCWILAALSLMPVTQIGGYIVVAVMVLAALWRFIKDPTGRARLHESWSQFGLGAELSLLLGVTVVFVVWLIDPQFLALGEKVDAVYLQYFTRHEVIPPVDILNPTESMSGFYFDRFLLGWFLKGVGVEGEYAVPISMLAIGAIFGSAVFSLMSALIGKKGLASAVSAVCIIPVVLGVLVIRESRSPTTSVELAQLKPEQKQLVTWLSRSVEGAPVVVDSCSTTNSSGVSLAAGLPAFQRISGEPSQDADVGGAVCGSSDPQVLFDSMMKYGAALYIVGASLDDEGVVASELENGMDNRPDLFAKVYDKAGLKVYAPAFSELYRTALRS